MKNDLYKDLPQVEKALEDPRIAAWFPVLSRPLAARIVADALAGIRDEIRQRGRTIAGSEVMARVDRACAAAAGRRIHRVINATGIILHTNMGRAPLSAPVWAAAAAANTGYANLELDLETGRRGKRNGLCPDLLRVLTGAEDALVVNNNAAAVLLMLTALASGREVIVSRGEQVQIGGGFRIPEILALSGARLVEVGTTNITTLEDYTAAVTEATAMVLVVHTSNFKVRGFTEKPRLSELAAALPPHVVLAVDQGSGTTTETIPGEERVSTLVRQGAQLVCFSGDKVLGGPQAGLVVGRSDLVARMDRHPLLRAFRPGKAVYSLLEQSLVARLGNGGTSLTESVLGLSSAELDSMAGRILAGLPREAARVVDGAISTGGGSAPDESHPSRFIELDTPRAPEETLSRLRGLPTPIIGIIVNDKVRLSLATMHGEDERLIAESILRVVRE